MPSLRFDSNEKCFVCIVSEDIIKGSQLLAIGSQEQGQEENYYVNIYVEINTDDQSGKTTPRQSVIKDINKYMKRQKAFDLIPDSKDCASNKLWKVPKSFSFTNFEAMVRNLPSGTTVKLTTIIDNRHYDNEYHGSKLS